MEEQVLLGKTILVVDDEEDLRDIIAGELEFMGAKVFQAPNITVAQTFICENLIDLVVSDIRMPGGTGIELLDTIKLKDNHSPPVILITGFADISAEEAFNKGAEALINKPFKLDDLIKAAVRYTLSEKERFKNVVSLPNKKIEQQFDATIENKKNHETFLLGRGGIALALENSETSYMVGDTIQFKLKFKDQTLVGTGICRWSRHVDHTPTKVAMGLEFINLDDDTLDYVLKSTHKQPMVSSIPSLTFK